MQQTLLPAVGRVLATTGGHECGERELFRESGCVHPICFFLRDRPDTSVALNLTVAVVPLMTLEFGLMQL